VGKASFRWGIKRRKTIATSVSLFQQKATTTHLDTTPTEPGRRCPVASALSYGNGEVAPRKLLCNTPVHSRSKRHRPRDPSATGRVTLPRHHPTRNVNPSRKTATGKTRFAVTFGRSFRPNSRSNIPDRDLRENTTRPQKKGGQTGTWRGLPVPSSTHPGGESGCICKESGKGAPIAPVARRVTGTINP
jgi:hypothetical protein